MKRQLARSLVCTLSLIAVAATALPGTVSAACAADADASDNSANTPATGRATELFAEAVLKQGEQHQVAFAGPTIEAGEEIILAFQARLHTPRPAGFARALRVTLNGRLVGSDRLLGKPLRAEAADGRIHWLASGDLFSVFYAPDFTSADASSYGMEGVKSADFFLRVTDLVRAGDNELIVANAAVAAVQTPLQLAAVRLLSGPLPATTAAAVAERNQAPDGPLAVIAPSSSHQVVYRVDTLPESNLRIALGDDVFTVESQFSTPDGQWARGATNFFRHERRVEQRAEAVVVYDQFENLTDANLPLMQLHRARAADKFARVWLGGLSPRSGEGATSSPANPSVFGTTAGGGLGLLPLNDQFLVHVRQFGAGGAIALEDNAFVLQPRARYTAEWAICPVPRPDYFAFVNAARRLRNVNFTLPDCFAFLRAGPLTEKWSDATFADFIRLKGATLVCASISDPLYEGVYSHGTAFQRVDRSGYRRWVDRVRRLTPGVQTCIYFHCFLDPVADSPHTYADARLLRPNGEQADYGEAVYRNYFPTATNSYGQAMRKNVALILDEIHADGVYWDEMEYSAHHWHYGEPWDGCSADIDPRTHQITRLKSSVALLSQPWRLALAKEIQARGPLIANGQPHTRSVAELRIPRFVETGSPSHCAEAQLYSPIALGDHHTERSVADAYQGMLMALDFGCLSHWYSDVQVMPRHATLASYMFPSTPLELGQGYLIARERIVTNRSGLFGWGDQSPSQVHAFDEQGRAVADFAAPQIVRDGQWFREIRLPRGWSAALVRQAAGSARGS